MPLYELFCLVKPGASRLALTDIIRTAGKSVLARGGVLTDIKSFGEQPIAYPIRKPGEKYSETHMWQITFASQSSALEDLDHNLRVNDDVLRWIVIKRQMLERLPNSHKVSKLAHLAGQ